MECSLLNKMLLSADLADGAEAVGDEDLPLCVHTGPRVQLPQILISC
jgi:hypothetical protein